jgi:hypothetical protein
LTLFLKIEEKSLLKKSGAFRGERGRKQATKLPMGREKNKEKERTKSTQRKVPKAGKQKPP